MSQTPRNNEVTSRGQCEQSIRMDSFKLYPREHSEEPDIRIPNMKETGKAGGNLYYKELETLKQRLEQELQYKYMEAKLKKLERELRKERRERSKK